MFSLNVNTLSRFFFSSFDIFCIFKNFFFFLVYVETGRSVTPTTLTFNPTMAASWRIKVSYIECNSRQRAPEGCLQYFTGASGEFKSFSFNDMDTSILLDTDYTVCIRRESGFCSIDYSVQETGTGMEFELGAAMAKVGAMATAEDAFLTIPGTKNIFYAGTKLSETTGDTKNSVVSCKYFTMQRITYICTRSPNKF